MAPDGDSVTRQCSVGNKRRRVQVWYSPLHYRNGNVQFGFSKRNLSFLNIKHCRSVAIRIFRLVDCRDEARTYVSSAEIFVDAGWQPMPKFLMVTPMWVRISRLGFSYCETHMRNVGGTHRRNVCGTHGWLRKVEERQATSIFARFEFCELSWMRATVAFVRH